MMELQDVLAELELAGTAHNRQVYLRHGAREPLFGVSFGGLHAMQRRLKRQQALAEALWASGNYDAMLLACLVADPHAITSAQADQWVAQAYNYVLAGELAGLLIESPLARGKAEAWMPAEGEFVARAGWLILAGLAANKDLPDEYLLNALQVIERSIHQSKNRVRDAMNMAVISIGLRPTLTAEALAAAARIGKVRVDHGQTGCKTPDAASYIQKTLAHRAQKARQAS